MPSPRQVSWAKFRTSAVILAALLILGTLAFLLTGGTVMQPKTQLYLYLPDATGVAPGSPVRVDGIGIGKVSLVELANSTEPNRIVRVTMTIERDRLSSITEDSTAEAASETMIGDKFIDVTSGIAARAIQPGAELRYKSSGDLMQRLDIGQFQKQMHVMELLLDDIEQGKGPLGEFIMGDTIYNDLRAKVAQLQKGIHVAAETTTAVGQALYTDTLYRQLADPLRQLDDSLASLQQGQGSGGQLLGDDKQFNQAREQVADLRHSIGTLRGGEMLASTGAYGEAVKRLDALIRQVDEFQASGMLTTPAAYDNLVGMARELQGTAREFRQNPRKFLRMKLF